jgi:hypothetical protein
MTSAPDGPEDGEPGSEARVRPMDCPQRPPHRGHRGAQCYKTFLHL